jgi:hypothetical protein
MVQNPLRKEFEEASFASRQKWEFEKGTRIQSLNLFTGLWANGPKYLPSWVSNRLPRIAPRRVLARGHTMGCGLSKEQAVTEPRARAPPQEDLFAAVRDARETFATTMRRSVSWSEVSRSRGPVPGGHTISWSGVSRSRGPVPGGHTMGCGLSKEQAVTEPRTRARPQEDLVAAVKDAREAFAARMRRISDAEALRRSAQVARSPLYEQIGYCDARRDRQEWRKRLKEPVELALRERDLETDIRMLLGDLDHRLKCVVLRGGNHRKVCFLVSAICHFFPACLCTRCSGYHGMCIACPSGSAGRTACSMSRDSAGQTKKKRRT